MRFANVNCLKKNEKSQFQSKICGKPKMSKIFKKIAWNFQKSVWNFQKSLKNCDNFRTNHGNFRIFLGNFRMRSFGNFRKFPEISGKIGHGNFRKFPEISGNFRKRNSISQPWIYLHWWFFRQHVRASCILNLSKHTLLNIDFSDIMKAIVVVSSLIIAIAITATIPGDKALYFNYRNCHFFAFYNFF